MMMTETWTTTTRRKRKRRRSQRPSTIRRTGVTSNLTRRLGVAASRPSTRGWIPITGWPLPGASYRWQVFINWLTFLISGIQLNQEFYIRVPDWLSDWISDRFKFLTSAPSQPFNALTSRRTENLCRGMGFRCKDTKNVCNFFKSCFDDFKNTFFSTWTFMEISLMEVVKCKGEYLLLLPTISVQYASLDALNL